MSSVRTLVIALVIALAATMAAQTQASPVQRDFAADLATKLGPLSEDEVRLAEYALLFYYARFGFDLGAGLTIKAAAASLSPEQYTYVLDKAGRFCKSKAAKTALKLGKAGEKLLKALIMAAEEAWKAGLKWADEGAAAYDASH